MNVVIDTNSLLSLVRYYLPFDKQGVLFQFIQSKIELGEFIIIDKVLEECKYTARGIVSSQLYYLTDTAFQKATNVPTKTDDLVLPNYKRFFDLLNNKFVNIPIRRNLTEVEFESEKSKFLESADMKQVILAYYMQEAGKPVVIVTEETKLNNDEKTFKKIPAICLELGITTKTLPELFQTYADLSIEFHHKTQVS